MDTITLLVLLAFAEAQIAVVLAAISFVRVRESASKVNMEQYEESEDEKIRRELEESRYQQARAREALRANGEGLSYDELASLVKELS